MKNKGRYYFEKKIVLLIGICIIIMSLSGCLVKNSNHEIDYRDEEKIMVSYMQKEFGENWTDNYQLGESFTPPFIEENHRFVRIKYSQDPPKVYPPAFSLLLIDNKVQRVYPQQYNKIIKKYNQKKIASNDDVLTAFETYLSLYGFASEQIFINHSNSFVNRMDPTLKEKIDLNLSEASKITVYKTDGFWADFWTVDLYTISVNPSYTSIPSPYDVIFTHYIVDVSDKGEIYFKERTQHIYPELVPAGPK